MTEHLSQKIFPTTQLEDADGEGHNSSINPTMGEIIGKRFSRRNFLQGSLAVSAIAATVSPVALMTAEKARAAGVSAWRFVLPAAGMALYPYWIEQVAGFLDKAEGAYDFDHWSKDVRFSLALSVPGAKSQVIDLSSPLGPKQIVRHALDGRGIGPLFRYLAAGAKKEPWLEVHTESRWLRGFNEEGWNEAWATAAELCRGRPELAGMIGSSWFYDPPLTEISPRLAHLRLNPLNGGAFMVHQGPGEIHTLRAGTASASRKALIDSGEYTARSWLMVWPRKELIAWADRRRH